MALRQLLVQASRDVPLGQLLDLLWAARRLMGVDRLSIARFGPGVLGLHGARLRDAGERAWWADKASEILAARLASRPEEVRALVDAAELARIEDAARAGRGVVLAAAHVGPVAVQADVVHQRFPGTLFLLRSPWSRPGGPRVIAVSSPAARITALVEARDQLRRGGLVWVAPDGKAIPDAVHVPLRARRLAMSRGAAALARATGAPALPIGAGWQARRIRLLVGEPIRPPDGEARAWELAWLTRYLATADAWASSAPENVPLDGIYDRLA
jgi:hypothetical protein